jgi:pyruvate formate lyase activating enzyme
MRGLIFNIQRFSVHDGPGIRTAVFLKGCALRCHWCQNPEGLSAAIRLWHFEKRCVSCGDCIPSCPEKALASGGPSRIVVDQMACTLCNPLHRGLPFGCACL